MAFTITRNLEQLPSYPTLCKLAEQNNVQLAGNERAGSFSCNGVEGNYEFVEDSLNGTFAGLGVKGRFAFRTGLAEVTVTDKPFFIPENLLRQKLTEGLNTLCDGLSSQQKV